MESSVWRDKYNKNQLLKVYTTVQYSTELLLKFHLLATIYKYNNKYQPNSYTYTIYT